MDSPNPMPPQVPPENARSGSAALGAAAQSTWPVTRTPQRSVPFRGRVLVILACTLGFVLAYGARSGALAAVWEVLTGNQIQPSGPPVAATHGKLSEHVREWVLSQRPQKQMEELMAGAINHDEGSTDLIMQQLPSWQGKLANTQRWSTLEMTALYSNDLRVRAAAIEVELTVFDIPRTPEEVEKLWQDGEENVKSRPFNAWIMGMLANRGVQTDGVREQLESWARDPDEQSRYWAVEGLAHIGTDDTIKDFLEVLRSDPSMDVRERAGCSLAKSGMMTREQRMKAVPGLLDLAGDTSLDSTTSNWVFQALREITDVQLPNDPAAWRNWYTAHGAEQAEKFRESGGSVLGNS